MSDLDHSIVLAALQREENAASDAIRRALNGVAIAQGRGKDPPTEAAGALERIGTALEYHTRVMVQIQIVRDAKVSAFNAEPE